MNLSAFFYQVKLIKSVIPYHQLMTPKWLAKHATIHGSYTYKPNYLEILAGTDLQHVLQVQLVPPGVLTNDDSKCVTVTMTIAMDTVWADDSDHDPNCGISDGERFIGFRVMDKANYTIHSPCHLVEGDNAKDVQIEYSIVLVLDQIPHKVTPVRLRYR